MIQNKDNQFGKPLYILYPGDHYATKEDCVLGTVTGLCVAICLYEPGKGIGSMGHFIVPGSMGTEGIISDEIAARGITNIEYLIADIVKLGGDRRYLKAKIFGAGYSLSAIKESVALAESNIRFIHEYFTLEKIHIERIDLGGDFRRRIYFFTKDGVVYRQILKNNEEASEFVVLEKEYVDTEFRNRKKSGRVVLFD